MKSSSSQFTDKQIMDLSQSANNNNNAKDLIDLINSNPNNPNPNNKDDEIEETTVVPSYDFHPIRPLRTSSSSTGVAVVVGDDDDDDVAADSVWNAIDSKQRSLSTSPIRSYGSVHTTQPAKASHVKERNLSDADVLSEIDKTMKKYTDNLLHALEGVSARLTQLETRSRHLEDSMDDLKASVGNNYGSTDGKMRQLENIIREVHTGVKDLKDKQDVVEAQLQLAKLQVSKTEHRKESQSTVHVSSQQAASAPSQHHQQIPHPPVAPSQPVSSLPQNAPAPVLAQQNVPPFIQRPNQFPQNQIASVPPHEAYFQSAGQTQETQPEQYQLPPTQPTHPSPMGPPHQQYLAPSQPPYMPPSQPTQQQPLHPVNSHLQPSAVQHAEESPYITPQSYPPSVRQPPPQPTSGLPPAQHYYGAPPPNYDQPPSRSNSALSSGYGPHSETYSYGGSTSQYGSNLAMKPQQSSLPAASHSHLPTARVLPQALPTASGVGSGSGSPRSGSSRVPIDDVVDKVTSMGFPRDHVKATVKRLTENGQSVDLNAVLDKLMNDGEFQPPRGWFGR